MDTVKKRLLMAQLTMSTFIAAELQKNISICSFPFCGEKKNTEETSKRNIIQHGPAQVHSHL